MLDSKRIVKNTVFLYFRTILVMVVSLYTSRVVLNALGVENYGIYNVIGGFVAMFAVVSGALSGAISRFITFELGRGDSHKIANVFSTSMNIQIGISILLILIGETLGVWFLNNKLNIPADRLSASFWVLQCSLATFCVNLISVPYNACIIAHEHMRAFAYISVAEALFKLAICYLIAVSTFDKLIVYAFLLLCVACLILLFYSVYCHKFFPESSFHFIFDRKLIKEMGSFAGWNFFTNGAYVFNTQGVNVLINMFFGVGFNAARGVALQVEGAVMQFVNNFGTALNPQITKSYAAKQYEEMNILVCKGARFSYLLLMFISFPFLFEAEYVLKLWLNVVPDCSALFFRLGIIGAMCTMLGNTGYTACMATGNIRRYVLWITLVGCLVFPFTYIAYVMGAPVYASYLAYIGVYFLLNFIRLWIMKSLLNFPVWMFIKDVYGKIMITTVVALILPIVVRINFETSFLRFLLSCFVCFISTISAICIFGVSKNERNMAVAAIKKKINR